LGVVINYSGVALFAVIFCIGEYGTWNAALIVFEVMALAAIAFSFRHAYVKTGTWELTHTPAEKLDEREIQVTHDSYRSSFGIFTAVSLLFVIFMVFSVRFSFVTLTHRGHYSFGLVAVILLNYLAHILPSSQIVWKQPDVFVDT